MWGGGVRVGGVRDGVWGCEGGVGGVRGGGPRGGE